MVERQACENGKIWFGLVWFIEFFFVVVWLFLVGLKLNGSTLVDHASKEQERERERERERECGVREEEGIRGGGDDAGKQRPSQVAVGISTF